MSVRVSRISGDASGAPKIVVHSVGSDGMEASRVILSMAEAERHMLALQRAIGLSRAETARGASAIDTGAATLRLHEVTP